MHSRDMGENTSQSAYLTTCGLVVTLTSWLDPCAAAASRRAKTLCHAPRRRGIFVAQPNSSQKQKFYQPDEYFWALTEIESIISFQTRSDYVDNILKYWSDQASCNNMPILCQLAELYLGMTSSSVPVECLFSSAALIANGKCSSSKPYKLEHILFVHDNFYLARDSLLTAHCAQ